VKSVKIYGWDVPIIKEPNLMDQHGFLGFYDPQNKQIRIDPRLKGAAFTSTLLHEMVHALFDRGGLAQTRIPSSLEEIICEQLSTIILENFELTPKRKR
jgi:hypothetical protein